MTCLQPESASAMLLDSLAIVNQSLVPTNVIECISDARQEFTFALPSSCAGLKVRIRVPDFLFGFGRDVYIDAFELWE